MLNPRNVVLSQEELEMCMEFSARNAKNQQRIEFGQKTTKARGLEETARDNMIGKLAEVAFSKIMRENYGISVLLDFNFYPRGQWDEEDAMINGWKIDVKGTRRGGKWMLIEWNKLNFRQNERNLSHAFVMFTVDWDREMDKPTGTVRFEGIASLAKMSPFCETTKVLRKGELLPGTNMKLQADNYGIRFTDLSSNLDGFVSYITKNKPPNRLTEEFRNPYIDEFSLAFNH